MIRIGSEELSRNRGRSLPELINTKSGIEISGSRGRAGEVLGAFVRGGRGRQLIVLIDGLRVSDPSSFSQEFDLRLLPLDNIASIEIIKGANSTLYGANAATAVINITTKDAPVDRKTTQVRLATQRFEGSVDLVAQLARRRDDEGLNAAPGCFDQTLQNRQNKSSGLACPGLGQT